MKKKERQSSLIKILWLGATLFCFIVCTRCNSRYFLSEMVQEALLYYIFVIGLVKMAGYKHITLFAISLLYLSDQMFQVISSPVVSWHRPYRNPGMSYAVCRMTFADAELKFCELSSLFSILYSLGCLHTHVFPQTQYTKFAPKHALQQNLDVGPMRNDWQYLSEVAK